MNPEYLVILEINGKISGCHRKICAMSGKFLEMIKQLNIIITDFSIPRKSFDQDSDVENERDEPESDDEQSTIDFEIVTISFIDSIHLNENNKSLALQIAEKEEYTKDLLREIWNNTVDLKTEYHLSAEIRKYLGIIEKKTGKDAEIEELCKKIIELESLLDKVLEKNGMNKERIMQKFKKNEKTSDNEDKERRWRSLVRKSGTVVSRMKGKTYDSDQEYE